jgi:uncharacterized membrane protein YbaN (DUF454 family)
MKLKKALFLVAGLLALGLGVVGAVLPILPSTPFLIVALFCFARSSERLHKWLLSTSLYKKHLHSFVAGKPMLLKSKLTIIASVTVVMAIAFFLMSGVVLGRIVLVAVWLAHIVYFFAFVKTDGVKERKGAQRQ